MLIVYQNSRYFSILDTSSKPSGQLKYVLLSPCLTPLCLPVYVVSGGRRQLLLGMTEGALPSDSADLILVVTGQEGISANIRKDNGIRTTASNRYEKQDSSHGHYNFIRMPFHTRCLLYSHYASTSLI